MSEEERWEEVPAFYRKLGGKRDVTYRFDGSPEAWGCGKSCWNKATKPVLGPQL